MTAAVRAALLPHPPLLVPELAGGAAGELDPLRAACRLAVDDVLAASSALVVIGDGPVWGIAARAAVGSFLPYGAEVEVRLPEDRLWADLAALPEPHRLDELPLSLAIAAWLLARPAGALREAADPRAGEEGDDRVAEADGAPLAARASGDARPAGADVRRDEEGGPQAAEAGTRSAGARGPADAQPEGADARRAEKRHLRVADAGERSAAARASGGAPPAAETRRGERPALRVAEAGEAPASAARVGRPAGEGAEAGGGKVPPLIACTVPATLGPRAAAAVGHTLVETAAVGGPVGVIAMADLSARRSAAAPGAYHPAAARFDAGIADALVRGDLDALAALDPVEAAELLVGGRAVLQALAGAMRGGARPAGRVLYDEAPYGVGYLVAVLTNLAAEAAPAAGAQSR
jgi:hypothetical protein